MSAPRRILMVEDSADDAELAARTLRRSGCELTFERVETPEAMCAALRREKWDLVIADYSMPHFNGLAALKLLQQQGLDLPFILVSGTVGEEVAVEAMKCGAGDYVLKNNLVRLPLAVERELRDFEMRGARKRAEEEANRARDRVRDLALETARLRSDFLTSMSHEIRTPLAGIIGTGELLSLSDLTPEQRRQTDVHSIKRRATADAGQRHTRLFETLSWQGCARRARLRPGRIDGKSGRFFCDSCSCQRDRDWPACGRRICRPVCEVIRPGCARFSTTWCRTRSSSPSRAR